jgi:hypothetical protein
MVSSRNSDQAHQTDFGWLMTHERLSVWPIPLRAVSRAEMRTRPGAMYNVSRLRP